VLKVFKNGRKIVFEGGKRRGLRLSQNFVVLSLFFAAATCLEKREKSYLNCHEKAKLNHGNSYFISKVFHDGNRHINFYLFPS
jgi:hypothetical protein